jgi:hypothetical protein
MKIVLVISAVTSIVGLLALRAGMEAGEVGVRGEVVENGNSAIAGVSTTADLSSRYIFSALGEPPVNGACFMRHTFTEVARSGDWQSAELGESLCLTPTGEIPHEVVLADMDGQELTITVPVGGGYVITETTLIFEFMAQPSMVEGIHESIEHALTEDCWEKSTLSTWSYSGNCWGLRLWSQSLQCWIKRCDNATEGDCKLTVTPIGGQPTTYTGACASSSYTSECGGTLCFNH